MSIKSMATKLALAFVAKKGMDALSGMGGISGLKSKLQSNNGTSSDTQTAQSSSNGGLGGLLGKLGMADGAAGSGSIGGMLGSLSSVLGSKPASNDLETQFAGTDPVSDDDAGPVLRAMVQMARADGVIDEQEQSAFFDILEDATPDEKAILTAALREPVDAHALARDTPAYARKEVYSAALLIGTPDTHEERAFLQSLATGLDLDQRDLDALHGAMGKPPMMLA